MLQQIPLSHPNERLNKFDLIHPKTHTWVVSDLKTKSVLQDRMLNRFEMIEDDSILRISELWRLLFFRHFPSWRTLSSDLTKALFQTWSEKSTYKWANSAGANAEIFQLVQFLAPVFESQSSHEQLGDWFRNNPMSYLNWGEWYLVAKEYWGRLKEKKWIPGGAMGAALISVEEDFRWNKPIFIDVGAELAPFEAELIKKLARNLDVHVLQPDFGDTGLSYAYDLLGFAAHKSNLQQVPHAEVKRFATSLSETKDCVHQVRKWIEADGIQPHRVVVVAPDPKPFERVLDLYMKEEGVPFTCDSTSSLTDLPTFCDWLASLSLAQNPQTESIEQIVFRLSKKPLVDIETFRSLYSNIYTEADLSRHQGVYESIKEFLNHTTGLILRDTFIANAIGLIPAEAPMERFESFLKSFLLDIPTDLELPLGGWIAYLKARALKSEIKIGLGQSGVRLIKVDSFDDLEVDRAYIMDLTEKSLKSKTVERIEVSDIRRLASDLGWPIQVEDPRINEWKIKWSMQGIAGSVVAVSSTDWFGDTQSPSLLWLDHAIQTQRSVEEIDKPRRTVWDSLQSEAREKSYRDKDTMQFKALVERIDIDRGEAPLEGFPFDPPHLSASGVEDYRRCPFIFAAKRVFGLVDYSEIDLDIDPMTRGSLLHRAFELLLEGGAPPAGVDEDHLFKLLDTSAVDVNLRTRETVFWPSQRSVYARVLKRFLEFEHEWRGAHPKTFSIGRELEVSGHFDPTSKKFSRERTEKSVAFKGRIDRVDKGEFGEVFLIDYKSSSTGLVKLQPPKSGALWSWVEKNKFQLVLYALAMEAGLSELGPVKTLGVAYFDFKKMERKLGFKSSELQTSLFVENDDEPTDLTAQQVDELMKLVAGIYGEVLMAVREGKFAPQPKKPEDCPSCEWRTVCRASHLN